jgi:O-antigen/teichoic acid export membrane protein
MEESGGQIMGIARTPLERAKSFLSPKLQQVFHFLTKQGIAMAGNMLYGLLCVRMLPIPSYAKFAVLFGFMGSLTTLLDIGISGTLTPLVGEQIANLPLIASYVASIRRIALRMYLVVAPVAAIVFVLLVHRQHWGELVVAQMVVALLVTAWFARVSSAYGAVLILRRDRSRYYRTQIIGSLGSLALLVIFWALHSVNVYVGILLNVAQTLFLAFSYYRRARQLLGVKGHPSPQQEKAIVRLAMPNAPSTIFYSIQGQIMLMLITVFGHNVSSVANIGALSRLGQILILFSQMNVILVEPFFAKLQLARLKRIYLSALGLVLIGVSGFSALAFLFPEAFLWILGPHYSQLRVEVGLMVLSSAIQYLGGFLWVVHSSRRFVYWWVTIANIALTLGVEVLFIWKFDLSVVRNVLILNVASAVVSLMVNLSCGVYGFWRGGQKLLRSELHEGLESGT